MGPDDTLKLSRRAEQHEKMNIKKLIKWFLLPVILCTALYFGNELYFKEWRRAYTERRVQKSIIRNYEKNKEKFDELIKYVEGLGMTPVYDLEFDGNGEIDCYLYDLERTYSTWHNAQIYRIEPDDKRRNGTRQIDFNIQPDGIAKIHYAYSYTEESIKEYEPELQDKIRSTMPYDTIVETKKWTWHFSGGKDHQYFNKLTHYLDITEYQLDTLRSLIRAVDCEAISISSNGLMSLRYVGISSYYYRYFIFKDPIEDCEDLQRLDPNVCCGLSDSGMFCGVIYFTK